MKKKCFTLCFWLMWSHISFNSLLPGNSSLSSASTAAISCLWTYKSNNLDDIFNLIEWVIDWRLTPSELYFSNIHDKNKFFTNNTSCLQKCRIVTWQMFKLPQENKGVIDRVRKYCHITGQQWSLLQITGQQITTTTILLNIKSWMERVWYLPYTRQIFTSCP